MKKHGKGIWAVCISLLFLLTACTKAEINIAEQLELGQKYLSEGNYESAVVAFAKIISIDAKHVEANRQIAVAYQETNRPKEAAEALLNVVLQPERTPEDIQAMKAALQAMEDPETVVVLTQMAYSQTGSEEFLQILFAAKGQQKDFEGIDRLIQDVNILNGMKDEYLEVLIQDYYEQGDYESMKQLTGVLKDNESCQGMTLVLDLLAVYQESGEEGIIKLLETFYEMEEKLPVIDKDSEVYIGEYDGEGLRSGFGICLYGANVKVTSRIYVGNWEKGLRSGEGRAYRTADYRIQCSWKDDYPDGEVTILQGSVTVLGTLSMGHVATPMNLYEDGEWASVHCTPDATKSSGYSFQTVKSTNPGTCQHVEKHSYCWDCQTQEQEEEVQP